MAAETQDELVTNLHSVRLLEGEKKTAVPFLGRLSLNMQTALTVTKHVDCTNCH